MSTELKRVALDFQWPIDKVWTGFLNPHNDSVEKCKLCEGSGYSPYAHSLHEKWYGYTEFHPRETGSTPFLPTDPVIVGQIGSKISRDEEKYKFYREAHFQFKMGMVHPVLDSDRSTLEQFERKWDVKVSRRLVEDIPPVLMTEAIRMCNIYNGSMMHHLDDNDVQALVADHRVKDLTHDFVPGQGWTEKSPKVMPSAREVNYWGLSGIGHDSMNQYSVLIGRCERANQPSLCVVCEGDGYTQSKKSRELAEAWQPTEPPAGDGYQMWETISEGAPISPVFETAQELAFWLTDNVPHKGLSRYQWLKVIENGGAPMSFAIVNGKKMNGEEAVAGGHV